jgi:hypothetical protein
MSRVATVGYMLYDVDVRAVLLYYRSLLERLLLLLLLSRLQHHITTARCRLRLLLDGDEAREPSPIDA